MNRRFIIFEHNSWDYISSRNLGHSVKHCSFLRNTFGIRPLDYKSTGADLVSKSLLVDLVLMFSLFSSFVFLPWSPEKILFLFENYLVELNWNPLCLYSGGSRRFKKKSILIRLRYLTQNTKSQGQEHQSPITTVNLLKIQINWRRRNLLWVSNQIFRERTHYSLTRTNSQTVIIK